MHVDDGVVSTVGVGDELEPRWAPHFCEITLKVYTLYEVDTLHGQFGVDFTVMLDWRDRTLAEAAARGEAKTWLPGEHWFPDVLLDNAVVGALEVVGGQASARIADASKGHVKQTQRYRCSLRTSFNMRDFPFDSHELEFRFLCRSLGSSIRGRGTSRAFTCLHKPALTDESALRDHGHSIVPTADGLPEWAIYHELLDGVRPNVKLDHGNVKHGRDASEFSIYWRVKRDPDCIIWNNIVFLATLSLISSMAYNIAAANFEARLNVSITMALVEAAFKYAMAGSMPIIPYRTTYDVYMLLRFMMHAVQAGGFVIASNLDGQQAKNFDRACLVAYFVLVVVMPHAYLTMAYRRANGSANSVRGTRNPLLQ